MIWNHILDPKLCSGPRTKYDAPSTYFNTNYATVAWEWHAHFGSRNFSSLVLSQSDIPEFKRIFDETRRFNQGRRLGLGRLWLHVSLPPYSCEKCNVEETAEEANTNSKIYTTALWDLFTCLWEWDSGERKSGRQLCLGMVLSVSSPSDSAHHFRYVQPRNITLRGNCLIKGDSDLADIHDEAHGWYGGVQVTPCQGARLRHVGKPLVFDLAHVGGLLPPFSLPKLNFVYNLWIPRQFHRAIPQLGHIFSSLPKLWTFNHESWCHVQASDEWSSTKDWRQIVESLPRGLEKLSLSEDHTEALNSGVERAYDPVVALGLRLESLNLVELGASGLADAFSFFWPFSAERGAEFLAHAVSQYAWDRLEILSLASEYLTLEGILPRRHTLTNWQEIENLLQSAATAALLMPKLRIMQLWGARRHEACIFRYTASQADRRFHPCPREFEGPLLEWVDTESPATGFKPVVVLDSWQKIADKYGHGRLRTLGGYIPPRCINSRNSVLKYLDHWRYITQPHRQQVWEADNLEFAQTPPPKS